MKRPAVFFDRDNTLIACDGYLGDPAKVVLIEGAAKAVARVQELGFAAVVFSNQSGVARGMFGEDAVHAVNHRLDDLLHEDDPRAVIDRHDFCPYHPTAKVERYRIDSDLRKPKPGMIYQAEKALGLDLPRSWVVGDAPRDIAAGHAAGLRTVLLKIASLPPSPATSEGAGVEPTFVATSLAEAMDYIERHAKLDAAPDKPKEAAADDSERVFEDEGESDAANAGGQEHDAPLPVPDDSREDDDSTPAEVSVAAAPTQVAEDSAASSAELKTEPDSPASVAATLVVPEPSQPERSSAIEAATSPTPERAEDTVKLTPRPNIKLDAIKPPAEPAKPAAAGGGGTEAAKPVQGGFVVKPNQAPQMTWGERMRVAKQGGTFTPPGSSAPAVQTPEAGSAATPTTASEDESSEGATARAAAVEEVTAELVNESSPASTEREAEAQPAMAMIVADSPATTTEPKRGQRREDSGESGGLAEERSSDEQGTATRSADGATREPVADDVPATAARRRSAVGDSSRTEELLEQILVELRRREEQGSLDFSVSKLLAGITQVLALAALFFAYLNQDKGTILQSTLLLALTLQTLTISLLIMGKQK